MITAELAWHFLNMTVRSPEDTVLRAPPQAYESESVKPVSQVMLINREVRETPI